jgi:hemophore
VASRKEYPMKLTTAAARRQLCGVLAAIASGGAATVVLTVPSATAASDPCAASSVAKTVSTVAKSTGEYLDKHPETNQVMTEAMRQQPGPQTLGTVKNHFDANPQVQSDFQSLTEPLTSLSAKCELPISLPQILGGLQAAQQAQGNLPGALPGGPGPQTLGAPSDSAPGPAASSPAAPGTGR